MEIKIPKNRKMNFVEFIAWQESEDDNTINEDWLQHWYSIVKEFLVSDSIEKHFGDCTKNPCPCQLCTLETLLKEYKEYYFT